MHRARSTEASGGLGALQRAMAWARNGLWDMFGLGIERQGPEEGGPLATNKPQAWAGAAGLGGQARVLGRESDSDAEATATAAEVSSAVVEGATEGEAGDAGGGAAPSAGAVHEDGEHSEHSGPRVAQGGAGAGSDKAAGDGCQ